MFKKPKKAAAPVITPKNPVLVEAEKAIARGQRIKSLSEEADLWRRFSAECKPGRRVREDIQLMYSMMTEEQVRSWVEPARLSVVMDDDTAPLWAAFAAQMAGQCERRLKDILNV